MFENELYYHIVKNDIVLLTNLLVDLLGEVDLATAETKYIMCNVRRAMKRQKKYPIENGFFYMCSYDTSLTKKQFALCFDVFMSIIPSYEASIKYAAQPFYEIVKAIRHNVYEQLSHIQDDMKSLIAFDDIPSKEWDDIVGYTSNIISSNSDFAGKSVLKTIQRASTALSEFDAYDILNSTSQPSFRPHQIHKVVKLSLQPYLFDLWNRKVKVRIGECFDKVLIDYELINLALNHFWNNAVKYTSRDSEIVINFTSQNHSINVTVSMYSLFISSSDQDSIFKKGTSGEFARKAKLNGTGLGMYYIKECTERSNSSFIITPGQNPQKIDGKIYSNNIFRFVLPKA